jgi:hypothetical protein
MGKIEKPRKSFYNDQNVVNYESSIRTQGRKEILFNK